jgi:hypothetical protein
VTATPLQAGRLEQTCPACGRWEAAGAYCTGCGRPTGPADWYANGDQAERERRGAVRDTLQARAAKPRTPPKQGRGRSRRVIEPEAVS